jgi:hypothetical protein
MKVNIEIELKKEQLPINNVAQILNAFALIHSGLNFMRAGDFREFEQNSYKLFDNWRQNLPENSIFWDSFFGLRFHYPDELIGSLYRLGERGYTANNDIYHFDKLSFIFQDIPNQYILKSLPSTYTPELVSIKKGTIEGEIKKIIDKIADIFRGVISSRTVMPRDTRNDNDKDLAIFLDQAGTESLSQDTRYIGAGITTTGAAILAINYRELLVTKVKTTASDDDDDEEEEQNAGAKAYS